MNISKSKQPGPALLLVSYFLAQRSKRPARSQPVMVSIKIGRNEPLPTWQRQEVQTVLFALTNKIDSKRGPDGPLLHLLTSR